MTHRTPRCLVLPAALAAISLTLAALSAGCEGWMQRSPGPAAPAAAPSPAPSDAAAGAWVLPSAASQPGERIERLANGLRVVVRERRIGGVAAFRIYIGAGSLNEGEFTGAGISHILEHLVAGGRTPTRSEEDVRAALDRIGAQTNAHTSKQFQCYHGQAAGEHVDELIAILADTVMNARFTEADFQREFEVVQREIERGDSNPGNRLWKLADAAFFLSHPARYPVIGYADNLRRLTYADLQKFYDRTFVPDNAVAVAVGDFSADAVVETIRKAMGAWPRRPSQPTVLPAREVQVAPRRAEEAMDVAAVRGIIEFPTVPLTHPDLYPLDILAFVLGEGRASRLVSDLRDRRGLVQSIDVSSYTPAGYDGGRFAVIFQAEPDKAAAAERLILDHLARVVAEPVTAEELARAKRQKISEHAFGLEECEAVATDMGLNALLVGDPHFSDQYVARIQGVTVADVRRAAALYLRPQVVTVTRITPPPKAVTAAESAAPATARPRVISRVLANGVRLLLCPIEGEPTVSIQMVMRGGLSIEDAKTAGTSSLMASLLMKGTAHHTAQEIAQILDGMGAQMGTSAGRNTVYLSAKCLSGDFDRTWDLAAECLLAPAFRAEELEIARAQTLAGLAQMEDSPQGEAGLYFNRMFFKDSPYQFPVQGTPQIVRGLSRDDLAAWHKQVVAGNNLVIAVFGGFDLAAGAARVAKAVEGLPKNDALAFPHDIAPRKTDGREVHIKGTQKNAAIVYVAYPGTDIFNVRDRAPLELMDTVMSGYRMPGGWLHEELRGKGLVYEVHAFTMEGLRPGYFAAYAVCQPEKAAEVAGIIEKAMARARAEAFTAEQLAPARATVITAKQLGRETVSSWAFESAVNEALGLGHAFAQAEIENIRKASPDDVGRVARAYLKDPVIVILTHDPKAAEAVRK
jgi:zinc protease